MDNEKTQQTLADLRLKIQHVEHQMLAVTKEAMASHPVYQRLVGQLDVLSSLYNELGRAADAHAAGEMLQGGT